MRPLTAPAQVTQQSENGQRERALPRPALAHQAHILTRENLDSEPSEDLSVSRISNRDIGREDRRSCANFCSLERRPQP